jgi:hypothetical protein
MTVSWTEYYSVHGRLALYEDEVAQNVEQLMRTGMTHLNDVIFTTSLRFTGVIHKMK